jgi:hypothetical protein
MNKYSLLGLILIIVLVIFITELAITRNLNTCTLKNIFLHNEICTYNNYIYKNIFQTHLLNRNKYKINILEIGAGNGDSTEFFLNLLNKHNINYNYTICELDSNYNDILQEKITKCNKYIDTKCEYVNNSWTKINRKYDVILTTIFSSVNENNYHIFKNALCNHDTVIFTIMSIFKLYKIRKFDFKVLFKKRISLFFYVLVLKI